MKKLLFATILAALSTQAAAETLETLKCNRDTMHLYKTSYEAFKAQEISFMNQGFEKLKLIKGPIDSDKGVMTDVNKTTVIAMFEMIAESGVRHERAEAMWEKLMACGWKA